MVKFSVIIPVYNGELYLEQCLNSVLEQSITNYEIVIVNDGSNDNTEKIIEKYLNLYSQIKVFKQKNKGVSSARNLGFDKAKGEYVFFVDADDILEKNALTKINEYLNENVDLLVFNIGKLHKDGTISNYTKLPIGGKDIKICKREKKDILYPLLISSKSYTFATNFIVKKSVISHLRFNEKMVMFEDLIFNMDMYSCVENCIIIADVLYLYRVNENSAVHSFNMVKLEDLNLAYNAKLKFAKENGCTIDADSLKVWYCDNIVYFYKTVLGNVDLEKELYSYIKNSAVTKSILYDVKKKHRSRSYYLFSDNLFIHIIAKACLWGRKLIQRINYK